MKHGQYHKWNPYQAIEPVSITNTSRAWAAIDKSTWGCESGGGPCSECGARGNPELKRPPREELAAESQLLSSGVLPRDLPRFPAPAVDTFHTSCEVCHSQNITYFRTSTKEAANYMLGQLQMWRQSVRYMQVTITVTKWVYMHEMYFWDECSRAIIQVNVISLLERSLNFFCDTTGGINVKQSWAHTSSWKQGAQKLMERRLSRLQPWARRSKVMWQGVKLW
jgi:hypothetical protein